MYFATISFLSALSFSWVVSKLLSGLSCATPGIAKPSVISMTAVLIALFVTCLRIVFTPLGLSVSLAETLPQKPLLVHCAPHRSSRLRSSPCRRGIVLFHCRCKGDRGVPKVER